jgi:hypothetical protein
MNAQPISSLELEKALAAKLEELLRAVSWLDGWQIQRVDSRVDEGADMRASVPLPGGGTATLFVVCQRELRPGSFGKLLEKKFSPTPKKSVVVPVLAQPWVSPRLAAICEEHGWSWFDLAGNCRLDVPGLLQIHHNGNKPTDKRPRPTANLSTREAGRVIRALLMPEHAGMRWTQREMQLCCQPKVSLGLVNKVIRYLRDEAFIEVGGDGGFRLVDPMKLLLAWRDAYRFDRHQRRGFFTLLQGKKLRDALTLFGLRTGGFAAYAAFSAADFQAPHVRQPKTWLYVREQDISLFEELIEAKQVDSGENLVVLIADDDGIFYLGDGGTVGENRMICTHAVQTYVDLSQCGGRGEEAADALLSQYLRPEWRGRGFNV